MMQAVLRKVSEFPNWAEEWFLPLLFCHAWDKAGLTPRKSRYNGTFELTNGTLATPMLILSSVASSPVFPVVTAKLGVL